MVIIFFKYESHVDQAALNSLPYVAKGNFEILILHPQLPRSWGLQCEPPNPVYASRRMKPSDFIHVKQALY